MPMRGQWIGPYTGNADGRVMIKIYEVDDHFEGTAYLRPSTNFTSCLPVGPSPTFHPPAQLLILSTIPP